MEIILLERVEKLGAIGDVVKVKDGFARNFLLPNKKALRANEANRKLFESNRSKIVADNESKRGDAEKAAKDVDGKTVKLIRQASNTGQLYGSVSARDMIDALDLDGVKLVKSQIVLDRPIKTIGMHDVRIVLHPEVTSMIKVNVARSPEEADLQAQGIDVMAQMFERDTATFTEDVVPGSAANEDSEPLKGDKADDGSAPAAEAAAEAPAADVEPSAEPAGDAESEEGAEGEESKSA